MTPSGCYAFPQSQNISRIQGTMCRSSSQERKCHEKITASLHHYAAGQQCDWVVYDRTWIISFESRCPARRLYGLAISCFPQTNLNLVFAIFTVLSTDYNVKESPHALQEQTSNYLEAVNETILSSWQSYRKCTDENEDRIPDNAATSVSNEEYGYVDKRPSKSPLLKIMHTGIYNGTLSEGLDISKNLIGRAYRSK